MYAHGSKLHAFDAATGRELWSAPLPSDTELTSYSTPVVGNGKVFIGSTDGAVHAYAARSGSADWVVQLATSTPVFGPRSRSR